MRFASLSRLAFGLALFLTVAVVPPAGSGPTPTPAGPQFRRGTLHIYHEGRRVTLTVEIANTMETRSHGLMYRTTLPENAGMLFVFEQEARWGFWMKNTLIPLSIGFIDSKWRLIEIRDMPIAADPANGPFPIYESSAPYRYALEVNQGFFQRKGITPGTRLELIPVK